MTLSVHSKAAEASATQPRGPDSLATRRYDTVDALRGVAMVWMTVFHFCFDLSHFGLWPQNFRVDPFWTTQIGRAHV